MKCERCGYRHRSSPGMLLLMAVNNLALAFLLSHVTPDSGWNDWFINWRWFAMWGSVVIGVFFALVATLGALVWFFDPTSYYESR